MFRRVIALTLLTLGATLASAQIVPGGIGGQALPPVGGALGDAREALEPLAAPVENSVRAVRQLAQDRLSRLQDLVRAHPREIQLDANGDPARAGELIVDDPDATLIDRAAAAGFRLIERGEIEGLGVAYARFAVPAGQSLAGAERRLRKLAKGHDVTADQLHFQAGSMASAAATAPPAAPASSDGADRIGIIDGGVPVSAGIQAGADQRGFARGAPAPSDHASAIASILAGASGVKGAAPGRKLAIADVYGRDPAGGNALAIAQAIGWMSAHGVPVVAISLVGPANPLLGRTIAAAQARGMTIVAAVGNDGPAAPPAYPASYPGVIAVTGVDGRDRALIEAGRAGHLDYAAPGADLLAADTQGRARPVRGASFAVPFVAARLALASGNPAARLRALDAQARDLGPRGPDKTYGRGLICADCATRAH